jgi:hypothetical protein
MVAGSGVTVPRLADLARDRVVFFKRFVAKTIVKHSRKLQRIQLDRWIGKEAQSVLQTVILLQSTSRLEYRAIIKVGTAGEDGKQTGWIPSTHAILFTEIYAIGFRVAGLEKARYHVKYQARVANGTETPPGFDETIINNIPAGSDVSYPHKYAICELQVQVIDDQSPEKRA